jgi:hypothetical protein
VVTVVNHLHLAKPLPREALDAVAGVFEGMQELGCRAFQVVEVADDHAIVILVLDSAEAAAAVGETFGGPWMREYVTPLLSGPTERSVGEAVCALGL